MGTYDQQGQLLSNNLTNYKISDIYSAPEMKIKFLTNRSNTAGLLNSKAVGEPPFMYGVSVYFSLLKAIQGFNPAYLVGFSAPITPEKVLLSLYGKNNACNH